LRESVDTIAKLSGSIENARPDLARHTGARRKSARHGRARHADALGNVGGGNKRTADTLLTHRQRPRPRLCTRVQIVYSVCMRVQPATAFAAEVALWGRSTDSDRRIGSRHGTSLDHRSRSPRYSTRFWPLLTIGSARVPTWPIGSQPAANKLSSASSRLSSRSRARCDK
jgi:hypothetical protein